jgi:hypothetical protein
LSPLLSGDFFCAITLKLAAIDNNAIRTRTTTCFYQAFTSRLHDRPVLPASAEGRKVSSNQSRFGFATRHQTGPEFDGYDQRQ